MDRQISDILPIAALAALFGLAGGAYIWETASGSGYEFFPVAAGLAAFLSTAGCWWLILVRPQRYNLWRGAAAGALSGGLAHYLCWYLLIVGANGCYWLAGGCASSLGEPPVDPLTGLAAAGVFSVFSLIVVGWITVPVGAVVGAIWAYKFSPRPPTR